MKRLLFLIMGVMFVGKAFSYMNPLDTYKNLEANLKFESHVFAKMGSEYGALFHNEKEGYCFIPVNEQDMERLNMEKIRTPKRHIEQDLSFESEALKPCGSEITLDSIDKESYQLASINPIWIWAFAGVVYLGQFIWGYYDDYHHQKNREAHDKELCALTESFGQKCDEVGKYPNERRVFEGSEIYQPISTSTPTNTEEGDFCTLCGCC